MRLGLERFELFLSLSIIVTVVGSLDEVLGPLLR